MVDLPFIVDPVLSHPGVRQLLRSPQQAWSNLLSPGPPNNSNNSSNIGSNNMNINNSNDIDNSNLGLCGEAHKVEGPVHGGSYDEDPVCWYSTEPSLEEWRVRVIELSTQVISF